MSKKIISTLLVVLLLFVAFAACAPSENTESPVGNASAESSVVQESSTPSTGTSSKIVKEGYTSVAGRSVEDLIKECTTIVRGKIARKLKAIEVTGLLYDDVTYTVVHTYYEIEVSELFKGSQQHAKKTSFWVLGGETENMIHIVNNGKTIPEIGSEQFFFIFEDRSDYQGEYTIKNDQISLGRYDLPEMFKDEPEGVNAKSIPADEFAEILRDKIAEANAQKKQ